MHCSSSSTTHLLEFVEVLADSRHVFDVDVLESEVTENVEPELVGKSESGRGRHDCRRTKEKSDKVQKDEAVVPAYCGSELKWCGVTSEWGENKERASSASRLVVVDASRSRSSDQNATCSTSTIVEEQEEGTTILHITAKGKKSGEGALPGYITTRSFLPHHSIMNDHPTRSDASASSCTTKASALVPSHHIAVASEDTHFSNSPHNSAAFFPTSLSTPLNCTAFAQSNPTSLITSSTSLLFPFLNLETTSFNQIGLLTALL